MPTYEYVCEKCGEKFEKFQSMKDKPLETCPKEVCKREKWGKGKVKKVIGAGAGLIFKGSGFYITDYRSDSYKQAAKKDSSSSSPTSSSGDSAKSGSSTPAPAAKKESSKPASGSKKH